MLVIAFGAAQAFWGIICAAVKRTRPVGSRKEVRLQFGVWLLMGLEFELAADIIRTAIAPKWADIGQVAAIAEIRTFLNYFLERDRVKAFDRTSPIKPE